ncbi:MAG: valine--tRNA ligase [Alphaproteobacteria bacterium]|nr:valine--tRNA ligase [Alphaproteobacteria bacterium]MDY4690057.1 valine--tRNA ligase [Alphaproteobacteria bacterium]
MLEKNYNPKDFEEKIYEKWENDGDFKPDMRSKKEAFSIVIPPPNVTGVLHMGHALDDTLQDILIRYNRMLGKKVLWQPGTDHAGIATQMVVERNLAKEGVTRHDLGREKFIEKVWEWRKQSGGTICRQLRRLGASCDWSRERFTMDEGLSRAVRKIFVSLYKDGLIFKAKKLVNWDPKLGTAVSDLEVVQKETVGKMYYYKYPIEGAEGEYIHIATTRPETMFGDTAVAVSKDNPKLAHLIGKNCIIPIINRVIPIIGDEHADPEKGTGAVKITPAHDFNDFEVGKRHNLPMINVLNPDATLNENTPYAGLTTMEARAKTIEKLTELGLMDKIEDHPMVIPYGDRSGVVIEPLMTDQWFVDAPKLAVAAIKAVEDGDMQFVPKSYEKTYFEWMRNIQPWCISRQLWWGHQMPIWYGPDGEIFCEENEEEAKAAAAKHYGKEVELTRETDVLDTWFSSGLWAFSTMGWPDETEFLKTFYPTSVLVTGFDIIFFWVARMMMMSMYMMKRVPFKKCYIHGLVRDEQGRKMSKSKGNTVDPMETIEKYGADALRFFMAAMETQGRDINLSDSRIQGYRNFATKLWNAARFCEMNECYSVKDFDVTSAKLEISKWIMAKAKEASAEVTENLNSFRFSDAANAVYQFIWGTFCDWYIELIKPIFYGENTDEIKEIRVVTAWTLDRILVMLHPFMPFITEELWDNLTARSGKLIHVAWPVDEAVNAADKNEIDRAIDIISAIRSLRASMSLPAVAKLHAYVKDASAETLAAVERQNALICKLARLEELDALGNRDVTKDMVQTVSHEAAILIPLKGVVDFEAERARLQKELETLNKNLEGYSRKLSNESFVAKAPAAVVAEEKRRQAEAQENKAKVEEALARIANF